MTFTAHTNGFFYLSIPMPSFAKPVTFCVTNYGPSDLMVDSGQLTGKPAAALHCRWIWDVQGLSPLYGRPQP